MKLFLLPLMIGSMISCGSVSKKSTAQSDTSYNLFNGKNLDGWINYGTEKWYVEDGLLICESGPDQAYGYLGTDMVYKDFELTLEFKQEANGNSGVFIRSSFEGTKVTGWQAEVAPPGHSTGGIYESYGRGWLIKPDPALDKHLRMGEWNKMKIIAVGGSLKTYLNGQLMIELQDEKIGAAEGQVALQIHDGGGIKVSWRDIHIKELSAKSEFMPYKVKP